MSPTSGHRVVALVLDQVGLLDLAAHSSGRDLHIEHGRGALLTADTVIVPGYEDESAVIPPAALSYS